MVSARRCSRPACKRPAVYTLTYVYRDSTAVLGPLAAYVEPHCYDLCSAHADRLTAPRSEEHRSELQSLAYLVCRLLLEKKKDNCEHTGPMNTKKQPNTTCKQNR